MRTVLFVVSLSLSACGGSPGACEFPARDGVPASCADGNARACEPMAASRGATFHSDQTCAERGFTVCDANGCRRP